MKSFSLRLCIILAGFFAFSASVYAFNPFGDLEKKLKEGLNQGQPKENNEKGQPGQQPTKPGATGLPFGLKLPTPGGTPSGGMAGSFEELTRETDRGPVGTLQLGFNQIGSVFGGYPNRLPSNDPKVQYLGQIIRTLAGGSRLPYPYRGWIVLLVNGPGDASAAAGGIVLVQTGLFSLVQSEDELAAVLAHELAHVEIDHSGWDFKAKEGAKVFDSLSSNSDKSASMTGAQSLYAVGTMRGFSVIAEAEADERAIELLSIAGYNPHALLRVIERLTGEKAKPVPGVRYAYIQEIKNRGSQEAGGGNKYPAERATLLLDALKQRKLSDTTDHPARTDRFKKITGS